MEITTGTIAALALVILLAPVVIEALGPVGNNRAKRQIGTIIAGAASLAVTVLQSEGVEVDSDSLKTLLVSWVLTKPGIQAMHDGYWTDKKIPQIRAVSEAEARDLNA